MEAGSGTKEADSKYYCCNCPHKIRSYMLRWRVTLHVPAAACTRIEIEWEICHVDLSLRSKCMAEIVSQI